MNKSKLYIICGLPFSGKSFNGKKIAELTNGQFLSYDELWKEMFDKTGKDFPWIELTRIAHSRISEALMKNTSIVYDTLNDTIANREVLRNLARDNNSEAVTVYINTPMEVITIRRKENEETKVRHSVPEDKFQEAADRFEAPISSEENVIEIKPDTDLQEIFKS